MKLEHLAYLRRRNNKNNTKWPTPNKLATVTKNVWNTVWKVSCKTLSKVSFKTPSWDGKIRTVLLATNCKSFSKYLVYKTPIGINNINSIMKDLISKSPLQKREKHLANHSVRKKLAKKLKQQQVSKSEMTSITGHNSEADLDAYDSNDEMQSQEKWIIKKLSLFASC